MIYKIYPALLFLFLSFTTDTKTTTEVKKVEKKNIASTVITSLDLRVKAAYSTLNTNNFDLPDIKSFTEALKGFYLLKEKGVIQKDLLTLIDFSLSSNMKRLWVIDMTTNTILFNSLVAHGRNTGEEFATAFSNLNSSSTCLGASLSLHQ